MIKNKYVVIMAGGRGERFWPKSRLKKPKHLISIVGKESMLTQTLKRLESIVPCENIFIITNKEQYQAVIENCPSLSEDQIIAEPMGRDTAAAVGLAKVLVKQRDPNAVFAILPADHVINDVENLKKCLDVAFDSAIANDVLVTLGIPPSFPSTAYGYIKKGLSHDNGFYVVNEFVEKPNLETAKIYLESGDYYWNAGMFVWSVSSIERALTLHCPDLSEKLFILEKQLSAKECLVSCLDVLYPQLPKISIDYALLEKAENVVTIPSTFDWDDVGEWPAVARHNTVDSDNNVICGESTLYQSTNNIVVNEEGHLTALVGVDNLIVVQTKDVTLICHKDKSQDIKQLLNQIRENAKHQHLL